MITDKPAIRIVLVTPPVIAGTARMITPIRSTITPRFLTNSLMVIDVFIIIFFSTANKAIITRLQKYFGTKMMKPLNLAFIFVK